MYIPPRLEKIFRFTVFKMLENSFVKSPSPLSSPWYDLIIDLLPNRTTCPINVAKKLCPPSAMKSFFRRKYPYTEGDGNNALAWQEIHEGVCVPLLFAKKWIKTY